MKRPNGPISGSGGAQHRVRCVIAAEQPVVRCGVRALLQQHAPVQVLAACADGNAGMRAATRLQADVLMIHVARGSLTDRVKSIAGELGHARLLLVADSLKPEQAAWALRAGARGVVATGAEVDEFSDALQSVRRGEFWVLGRRCEHLRQATQLLETSAAAKQRPFGLTVREMSVLSRIVNGCSNREIAEQFSISENTVKRHLSHTFDKTGVSSRLELAWFALAHRLVRQPVCTS